MGFRPVESLDRNEIERGSPAVGTKFRRTRLGASSVSQNLHDGKFYSSTILENGPDLPLSIDPSFSLQIPHFFVPHLNDSLNCI